MSRNCVTCGAPLLGRANAAKTCSEECARQRRASYLKERYRRERDDGIRAGRSAWMIACIVCGAVLGVERSANSMTCSPQCRARHRRRYFQEWHDAQKADDPDYRAAELARLRDRRASDPEFRDADNARFRRNERARRARARMAELKKEMKTYE